MESLLLDMPPLEDVADDEDLAINASPTEDEIIINIPQPYAYTNNKAILWSYDIEIDLVTRYGWSYSRANSQPVKSVTDEEAKEFLAVIKASEYNMIDQLRKLPA